MPLLFGWNVHWIGFDRDWWLRWCEENDHAIAFGPIGFTRGYTG